MLFFFVFFLFFLFFFVHPQTANISSFLLKWCYIYHANLLVLAFSEHMNDDEKRKILQAVKRLMTFFRDRMAPRERTADEKWNAEHNVVKKVLL